jgi:GH15 family glucan-1,4-alpha-glucosidase
MKFQPIENHGIIGDLHATALVGAEGTIDFMCFPNFDSPTIVAALLDRDKGGHFEIAPQSDEAKSFMRWIEARTHGTGTAGPLQVMYGIDGRCKLPEIQLSHLEGYQNSQPVRVGNAASQQLQLDIYAELMDSVYLYNKYGEPISHDFWLSLVWLVDRVCKHWQTPDRSNWEVGSGSRPVLYSRVMCWVAVDRAIRLAFYRSYPAPLERWRRVRDTIYQAIYRQFWDPKLRAFVQFKGAKTVWTPQACSCPC